MRPDHERWRVVSGSPVIGSGPAGQVLVRRCDVTDDPGMCPSQWEIATIDGRCLYVRYRHGRLSWGIGGDTDEAIDDSMTTNPGLQLGDEHDGFMETHEMLEWLREYIVVVDEGKHALGDRAETRPPR